MSGQLLPVSDSEFYSLHDSTVFPDMPDISDKILFQIFKSYLILCKIYRKKKPASLENTTFSYLPATFTSLLIPENFL